MKKDVAGFAATLVIIVVIVTVVILGPWSEGSTPWYNPEESLPHLSAPAEVPGEYVNDTLIGTVGFGLTASFHTMAPHNGPSTFSFTIDIIVNNTGGTIDDFHAVKVTIFDVNATPVYTFGVEPDSNFTIAANSTWTESYQKDRDMVSIPSDFRWAQYAFARILVTFDNSKEVILTTPLTQVWHAIE